MVRKNRRVRFGFGGSTVLLGSGGDQVSFNTTEGLWCLISFSQTAKQLDPWSFVSAYLKTL